MTKALFFYATALGACLDFLPPKSPCQNHITGILLARIQPIFIVPNLSAYKD